MTLYEIEQAYIEALEGCMDLETGEIIDQAKFDEVQEQYCRDKASKIENIMCLIKNKKSMADAVKTEKLKLADRQRVLENEVESLSNYLSAILGGEQYECAKGRVSFRKSESVEIDLEKFVTNEGWTDFVKYQDPKFNKADIKAAIKEGKKFEGAVLVEKNNIQIK